MSLLKEIRKLAIFSATGAILAFGIPSANAAGPYNTDTVAGTCIGASGGNDCGTATGHIGVSVVGTLSINEKRAINFGNVAVTSATPAGDAAVILAPAGTIGTVTGANTDGLVLLSGANANGGTGVGGQAGVVGNDGQQAGQYEISGANEGGQTRVYISFSTLTNGPLDANGDNFYPLNQVQVIGPTATETFLVDDFVFTAPAAGTLGKDVYGNYVSGAGAGPWLIAVGATLRTDAAATTGYSEGKYVGEFNITASY